MAVMADRTIMSSAARTSAFSARTRMTARRRGTMQSGSKLAFNSSVVVTPPPFQATVVGVVLCRARDRGSRLAKEDSNLQSSGSEPDVLPITPLAISRAGRDRTDDLVAPSHARCQAAPLPDGLDGESRTPDLRHPKPALHQAEPRPEVLPACGRRDSDPHTLCGYQALDLACLPFHHFRVDGRWATRASPGCRPPPPPVRAAGTRRRRRRVKLLPNHLGAEGETCTRTPRGAPASEAGMSAFHHFRLRPSSGQSLPGVSTPGPGGTKAGGPPGREALCRRGDLHPHASRHRVLGPACLRSTTSAGAPPVGAGLVPASGAGTPYRVRTGDLLLEGEACWPTPPTGLDRGACRARTDRLLIASEVLFLMS